LKVYILLVIILALHYYSLSTEDHFINFSNGFKVALICLLCYTVYIFGSTNWIAKHLSEFQKQNNYDIHQLDEIELKSSSEDRFISNELLDNYYVGQEDYSVN